MERLYPIPTDRRGKPMTTRYLVLFLLVLAAAVLTDGRRAGADSVMATVPVGSNPQQIQLTPDGSKLFVSNELSNIVTVISTATDTVMGQPIPVGTNPGPIRFTPNGAKAYVVNEGSDNVSVIDVTTLTETARVSVGTRPVTLSRTDDGAKVYVANELDNDVSVISTATDTVIGLPIAVGSAPHTMAKTPDGTELYVANEGNASNSISVIATASDSVVAIISLLPSRDPGSIHFLPNGTKAYVANRGCAGITCVPAEVAPTVSVINVATNMVIKTIAGCPPAPCVGLPGAAPHAMRITPNGAKLYLVNKHGDDVKVINTATDTIVKTILLQQGSCSNITFGVGSCPVRVELSPDASKAYVVEERPLGPSGRFTAICTGVVASVCGGGATDTVVGTVALGRSSVDLEVTGNSKAYVANSGSNNVSVVALDSDLDGCTDRAETGANLTLGGQRDPASFWDLMDVWTGSPPTRDKSITVGDIVPVVVRFGAVRGSTPTKEEALGEALTPPPSMTGYHADYDRGGPIPGQHPWNLLPPNGSITVGDISAVVGQFGHTCA